MDKGSSVLIYFEDIPISSVKCVFESKFLDLCEIFCFNKVFLAFLELLDSGDLTFILE